MGEDESTNVNIELDQADFEFLREYKAELGLTWEGLLKTGTPYREWKNQQYTTDE